MIRMYHHDNDHSSLEMQTSPRCIRTIDIMLIAISDSASAIYS